MKKLLSIALTLLLSFALCTSVFAATNNDGVTTYWTNTALVSPSISLGSSIYATDVIGLAGTSKIACTMVLYEKGWFGSYTEVSRNSQTVYQSGYTFVASYTYTSGKTYKLEITAVVTLNGKDETVSLSTEKKI